MVWFVLWAWLFVGYSSLLLGWVFGFGVSCVSLVLGVGVDMLLWGLVGVSLWFCMSYCCPRFLLLWVVGVWVVVGCILDCFLSRLQRLFWGVVCRCLG